MDREYLVSLKRDMCTGIPKLSSKYTETTALVALAERLEALVEEIREANKSLKLIANKGSDSR